MIEAGRSSHPIDVQMRKSLPHQFNLPKIKIIDHHNNFILYSVLLDLISMDFQSIKNAVSGNIAHFI